MPKVSVVIPVYNASEFLGQCLDTVLLQTLSDIEVICVDDGSVDDSLATLQGYAMFDERLKIITQENAGGGAARNRGFQEATGEYVIFLDADDFFDPNMLERMVARIEQDQSDVVVCGNFVFDHRLNRIQTRFKLMEEYFEHPYWAPDELSDKLFSFCNPAPWNKLIRRNLIINNKLYFDEKAHADDLMFHCLTLACASKISLMEDAFVYYRINIPEQQSKNKPDAVADVSKTLSKLYQELKRLHLSEKFFLDYLERLYRTLRFELSECPVTERRKALGSIRQNLPPEIFEKLFSSLLPQISVIIPVYNMAEYLPECLESVIHQTLENIEIICVDDGSTDNSLEILNQYAAKDSRIKVIHQENKGLAVSRNTALEQATGTYIQCLDADDYLEPDACECIYLYMTLFSADMCSFAAIEFNHATRKEFKEPYHCMNWLTDSIPAVFNWTNVQSILPNIAVTACLTVYKRGFLIQNDIHWVHKKMAYEDTPFFIEAILKNARVVALSDIFYHRRVHPGSITQSENSNFRDYLDAALETLKTVKKIGTDEVFLIYYFFFCSKAFRTFMRLNTESKVRFAPDLYSFYLLLLKMYHYPLLKECGVWCQTYLKGQPKKVKIQFMFYSFLALFNRSEFSINLISWRRKPRIMIKIFGIPVFKKSVKYDDLLN